MHAQTQSPAGWSGLAVRGAWASAGAAPQPFEAAIESALLRVDLPIHVVYHDDRWWVAQDGQAVLGADPAQCPAGYLPLIAHAPVLHPASLGDPHFRQLMGTRYAYVAGAMANGICSEAIVEAMAQAGMIGFFGSAGLSHERIEKAIDRIQSAVGNLPHGFNLIHSPSEPHMELGTVDLYLRRGVRLISASAFMDITPALVKYRVTGLYRDEQGVVIAPNRVVGKISRVEVARKFLSPAPPAILQTLVQQGAITAEQAALAAEIPMADGLTAEADSGGHTDNRPLVTLLPSMLALRDEMQLKHGYRRPLFVGGGGGVGTPHSAAAAFAMGACYVLTGSINQACVEAGTSAVVKDMLCKAAQPDVTMAAAADMFEMGVKVQVLKWGTLFGQRAARMYELYRAYPSLEALPAEVRTTLERDYFRCTLEQSWESTRAFFQKRDPVQIERAEKDPSHKMALVFRSYLGQSSKWAITGDATRKADYQIWCGPAMGAFNEWAKGSFLEGPQERDVATIGWNLLWGAAVVLRSEWLRQQGVPVPIGLPRVRPLRREELAPLMA